MTIQAEANDISIGEYIPDGGGGSLIISKTKNQQLHFEIQVIGSDSFCEMKGEIQNHQSVTDKEYSDCILEFTAKGKKIAVSTEKTFEECSVPCGVHIGFQGLYSKVPAGCTSKEFSTAYKQFDHFYATKAYGKAEKILEPLLKHCADTLYWLTVDRMRNDLAVTQYHLGQYKNCLQTLAPIKANMFPNGGKLPEIEEELRDALVPRDFYVFLPIAKATWHNWNLCTQKNSEVMRNNR
jgi:hypothetical protein